MKRLALVMCVVAVSIVGTHSCAPLQARDAAEPGITKASPGTFAGWRCTLIAGGESRPLFPVALAVDQLGNVAVLDSFNGWISRFDANAKPLGHFSGSGAARLGLPDAPFPVLGLAIAPDGSFYVADTRKDRLEVFSPDGEFLRQIKPEWLKQPYGMALDRQGNMYVLAGELPNEGIQKLSPHGALLATFQPDSKVGIGGGFCVDPADNIWALDRACRNVLRFGGDGKLLNTLPIGHTEGPGNPIEWGHVAADKDGHIYVAVRGLVLRSQDGKAFQPFLKGSIGPIAVDAAGAVWTAEFNRTFSGAEIKKYDRGGNLVARAAQAPGALALPCGLAVDNAGTIYVANQMGEPSITVFDHEGKPGPGLLVPWPKEPGWVSDVTVDSQGALLAMCLGDGVETFPMCRFAADGTVTSYTLAAPKAKFVGQPAAIAAGPDDRVYVTYWGANAVCAYALQAVSAALAAETIELKWDRQQDLFVQGLSYNPHVGLVAAGKDSIFCLSSDGQVLKRITRTPDWPWPPGWLTRIAASDSGDIYAAETSQDRLGGLIGRILHIGPDGKLAGVLDGDAQPDNAKFAWVRGLALDQAGNLYVLDFDSHKVLRFSPPGESAPARQ